MLLPLLHARVLFGRDSDCRSILAPMCALGFDTYSFFVLLCFFSGRVLLFSRHIWQLGGLFSRSLFGRRQIPLSDLACILLCSFDVLSWAGPVVHSAYVRLWAGSSSCVACSGASIRLSLDVCPHPPPPPAPSCAMSVWNLDSISIFKMAVLLINDIKKSHIGVFAHVRTPAGAGGVF